MAYALKTSAMTSDIWLIRAKHVIGVVRQDRDTDNATIFSHVCPCNHEGPMPVQLHTIPACMGIAAPSSKHYVERV